MARFAIEGIGRDRIDAVVTRWRDCCLLDDGSLLFDDRAIWTPTTLEDFRRRFLDSPLVGTGQNFREKIAQQLEDAEDAVRWLAAETVAVYLLCVWKLIGPAEKAKLVEDVASPLEPSTAPHWSDLIGAFSQGIANPGPGYNINRDLQLGYLLDFALRWKMLAAERQRRLLSDAGMLRDFADDTSHPIREMRQMLLHLLRPDDFERISSTDHKQRIVEEFRSEHLDGHPDAPTDLDEQLLFIRRRLEEAGLQPDQSVLDFYEPPLEHRWRTKKTKPTKPTAAGAWIFQANPAKFELDRALREIDEIVWDVRAHAKSISAGDRVYVWRSGPNGGVVALGRVVKDPVEMVSPRNELTYWKDEGDAEAAKLRVPVAIEQVLETPIYRDDLLEHGVLRDLAVIRGRTGTNFAVTSQQAHELDLLLAGPRKSRSPAVGCFILNQLDIGPGETAGRAGYQDVEGEVYRWTDRSSGAPRELASAAPGTQFAYYRPRTANDGTAQTYFGAGEIDEVEDLGEGGDERHHYRALLRGYQRFEHLVPLRDGPKRNAQTSIERVAPAAFAALLARGFEARWQPLDIAAVQEAVDAEGLRLPEHTVPSLVAAINSGKHVILTGPPGTAKTTLAQLVAEVARESGICRGYLPTTATADWTTYETIGGLRPQVDYTLEFEEGHFLSSIRDQEWLLIDELNRSNFDRAFGQLFTVLSGQAVTLPYERPGGTGRLVLLPPGASSAQPEADVLRIPESWRVIATMNVFDKSLLFEMSYALMRRFAFVEVPSPSRDDFLELIADWSDGDPSAVAVAVDLLKVRDPELKDLGPAVYRDIVRYARERASHGAASAGQLRYECFYSFLLPQFEGIDEEQGRLLFKRVSGLVGPELAETLRTTLNVVLGLSLPKALASQESEPAVEASAVEDEGRETDG